MKVLVVGGGGREHAIIWKLSQSLEITKLYCAPGNGGIASLAQCVPIKATDVEAIRDYAKSEGIDYVMVASDDPLALGLVDMLEDAGIPAFGPVKSAAAIEGSKAFAKAFMKKYNIPTARFEIFDKADDAIDYIVKTGAPIVVKADGLALGKGAIVAKTVDEAVAAVRDIMENRIFGDSGARVVIEECLTGQEVTVLAFTDGKTIVTMPPLQDHKRIFDGDEGPNTGGMGAVTHPVIYTPDVAERARREIFIPTIEGLAAEGRTFKGVIYFELMITPDGPKVIEYNARFGDPEAQTVLMLLKSDLFTILKATRDGRLSDVPVEWKEGSACCVMLASGGYPRKYETGLPISGLDGLCESDSLRVFHAGTRLDGDRIVTSGGRVLGVSACAKSLKDAIDRAYRAAEAISFSGMVMRRDIGAKNL